MSSEFPHYYSEDIEHLSNGFRQMGCAYPNPHGMNTNGSDDDTDDLKEEDLWGGHDANGYWSNSQRVNSEECSGYAMESDHSSRKGKGLKSRLSKELQDVGMKGHKKGRAGVGFADLDAMQNAGYGGGGDGNGGWAPGFSVRKVKIPFVGAGEGHSKYANGWHDPDLRGHRGGAPQSAPVSMPVWPAKCGYDNSNAYTDADDSSPKGFGGDYEESEEHSDDDDGGFNTERGRLAPHEIVDREYARSRSTTFSVIEGAGRTLKGSDLRRVRNAVWSCTGFED